MLLTDWFGFISALSLVVVMMLSLYDWHYKKRADLLKHSNDLYQALVNSLDLKGEIDPFKNSLKIDIEGKLDRSYDVDYSKESISHLKNNAYNNIYTLIERRNFYINKLYRPEFQKFSEQLIEDIINNINQIIPFEWDNIPHPEKRYFVRDNIQKDLMENICNNYINHNSIIVNISENMLYIKNQGIISDNKQELEKIKTLIETTFNTSIKNNTWLLEAYFIEIKIMHELLKKEIIQIKKDMDSNKPIKGKCPQCP